MIVDAEAGQGGHQVLDRGDLDAVPLQAGRHARIADAERIGLQIDRRRQIDAAEDHPGVGLRRTQHERNLGAGVQTHAGGLDDGFQGALTKHRMAIQWEMLQ
jgi:hypothetical protein